MSTSNQIVKPTEQRKLFCFSCGQEITFKGTRQRFNLDGTVHVCNQQEKEQYRQNKNNSSQQQEQKKKGGGSRGNRWYWGFGPGRVHKDNEKRYSGESYKQRRKAAEEQYNSYKQKYSNPESNISEYKALEILGLTKDVLQLVKEQKIQQFKNAFRKLALRFHPDRQPEGNEKKFIEVNSAYECLMVKHNGGSK